MSDSIEWWDKAIRCKRYTLFSVFFYFAVILRAHFALFITMIDMLLLVTQNDYKLTYKEDSQSVLQNSKITPNELMTQLICTWDTTIYSIYRNACLLHFFHSFFCSVLQFNECFDSIVKWLRRLGYTQLLPR